MPEPERYTYSIEPPVPARLTARDTDYLISHEVIHTLHALQEPVVFLDREWRFTYFNQSAGRISRLRPSDLHNKTHWELYPETIGSEVERKYRRAMEERVEEHLSFFYEPFQVWLDIRIVPIESGIALLYRDISAQKMEEQRRLEVTRRLEQVLEATTDVIISLDRSYNITFLNRRAREILAPSGDVLGQNLWEAFPATRIEGAPYAEQYHRCMDLGEPVEFETFYPEPLNIWITIQALPAPDGMILFVRDITEERHSKEALRRQQEEADHQRAEIETVYRTAPVGLALFDPVEFRYLRLNDRQAEFFGIPPEQVVGKTLTEMAPIPGLREMFEQVARGEPVCDQLIEGEVVTRPGEHRYWSVNYHPVFAADGSVQAISAVSVEITRLKQAEAALIQGEKLAAVGRLATSISHEINNPLEAVTNILYLMAIHEELPESLREFVGIAQAELARVSQIATQTLRFHRQSARQTLVTAAALVDPVLGLYQGRLANSGIEVNTRYSSKTPLLCFENDIRQVINNLIANAIDAMRSGGRLMVRAHDTTDPQTEQPGVRITIADTGHGMSPAVQARIFEAFYTTKELMGTGLGLWICSEIVQRHGGRLSLRSSVHPQHHGTVFSLFVPLRPEAQKPPSA